MTKDRQLRLLRCAARMIDERLRDQMAQGEHVECPCCSYCGPFDEQHQPDCPLKQYRDRLKRKARKP